MLTDKDITEKIIKIFSKVFPELSETDIDLNKTQDQYKNWDSFSHMQLVSNIEKEFEINLDIEEVITMSTPLDFIEVIKQKKI